MATPPLVNWAYSDWRLESDLSSRLDRLARHLQEVSGFVLESASKGHQLKLQQDYLASVQTEYDKLERKINVRQFGSNRFGVSSFERGAGP